MTNLEYFKKRINEMSAEEIGEIWQSEEMPWCNSLCVEETCVECVVKWANQPHIDPMPQLKTGMFVEWDGHLLGVVVNNFIVFQDGTYASDMSEASKHITKVFANIVCFNECSMMKPTWSKD